MDNFILGPSIGVEVVQEFGRFGGSVIGLSYHQQGIDYPSDIAGNQFTDRIHYVGMYLAGRFTIWRFYLDIGGSVALDVAGDLTYTVNGEDATQYFEQNLRRTVTNNVFAYGGLWYTLADRKIRIGATYEHGLNDIYPQRS